MPKEIEHKFLVRPELLPRPLAAGRRIVQGFLSVRPVVRVRLVSTGRKRTGFLTIKGAGLRERDEFEYAIPPADVRRLLKLCEGRLVFKTRRRFGRWEVDQFHGRHAGLWLAECELPSTRSRLPPLPVWLGREVTADSRYSNASLAVATSVPE